MVGSVVGRDDTVLVAVSAVQATNTSATISRMNIILNNSNPTRWLAATHHSGTLPSLLPSPIAQAVFRTLPNTHTPIHNHMCPSHVRSIIRRQERHDRRDLSRFAHPLHQRVLSEVDVRLLTIQT